MDRVGAVLRAWNRRLDGIWAEDAKETKRDAAAKPEPESRRKRAASFLYERRWELLFVAVMGALLFALSWILPFNEAPDEETRYLVPLYIYRHGTLPAGWDPEIQNEIWGISYAYHPILPYILGGYLMKLVGLFNSSDKALLMAARSVNVMLGMGFYWYVLQIAKKLFADRLFRCYFIALLALLPQLLYLFVYVNTDGIAIFSSALILNYWLEGLLSRWNRRSCTGLGVGVAVCALSYFNAYGYALLSVVLFVASLAVFYRKKGAAACAAIILKRGCFIAAIVFLLSGWWFIRCGILYHGDFLGLSASEPYAEEYALDEYKPSVKQSLQEQGVSLEEMLAPDSEGGMNWLQTTYRSLIGYFGYLKYPLGLDIYEIHKKLWVLGILGTALSALLFLAQSALKALRKLPGGAAGLRDGGFAGRQGSPELLIAKHKGKNTKSAVQGTPPAASDIGTEFLRPVSDRTETNFVFGRQTPDEKFRDAGGMGRGESPARRPRRGFQNPLGMNCGSPEKTANFAILQFSLVCCIIIPAVLSLYYSYTSDFQPQGRYLMPMIVPVMYFTAAGTQRILTLTCRRWFACLLMAPLFYAVLHVFLAAFVSVYLPAYAEGLQGLAGVRFQWLSNYRLLVYLLSLIIPG